MNKLTTYTDPILDRQINDICAGFLPLTGTGSPIGTVIPRRRGDFYLDTAANIFYQSYGIANTEWCTHSSINKFGTVTNYTEFEADGTMVAHGDATTWDDAYPSSVTVGVGATAPSFTAYNGNMKAYEFTGITSDKEIHMGFQIPHSYKLESAISPHLHLFFTSGAADVGKTIIFDCEYTWTNIGQTGAVATTTMRGTHTIAANSTTYNNEIFAFNTTNPTPIAGTGKGISSVFMCRIVRMQSVDTFTGSVWLKSADIHFEKDTIGSRSITTK